MKNNKSHPILAFIMIITFIVALSIDALLIVKTLENHRKDEALFSMDYYKKEETYKNFNDVFNFYSGKITKEQALELGKLAKKHNIVNKKQIYQVMISLEDMKFPIKDDIDYSKFEECIVDDNYYATLQYDETTTLVSEIHLTKIVGE